MDHKVGKDTVRRESTLTSSSIAEQAERYRAYFANSPLAVMVVDASGRYVEVNPAASRISGYEEAELLAMSLADLVAEDSQDAGLKHFARVKEVGHASGEYSLIRKDGSKRWITCDAVRLSEDRFIAFKLDITDRKRVNEALQRSQASFRSMFFDSSLGMEAYDAEGRLLQVNRACLDIFWG
jgi:PAS domain S-box-containing protein